MKKTKTFLVVVLLCLMGPGHLLSQATFHEKHGQQTEITAEAIPGPSSVTRSFVGDVSFEADEGFALGFLGGQESWNTFANNTLQPIVSDLKASDGIWSLELSKHTGLSNGSFIGAFSPLFKNNDAIQEYLFDILIEDDGGADYHVILQAPSQGFLTARVRFDWLGNIWVLDNPGGGRAFQNTGVAYLLNQWATLRIVMNFDDETIDYYYGGSLIYQGIVYAGTTVEQYAIFHDNWNDGESGFIDNIRVIEQAPSVPLSNWALYLGILLMITFVAIRFRRMI